MPELTIRSAAPTRWAWWRAWVRPHPSLTDIALRRKSSLLAALISLVGAAFVGVDTAFVLLRPGYMPPWFGYLVILTIYVANRRGHYWFAARLLVAMFPGVAFALVLTRASSDPSGTLSYVMLAPLIGMVFLRAREVFIVTVACLLGVISLPWLVVRPGLSHAALIGREAGIVLAGLLALTYMRHRSRIELERRDELERNQERARLAIDATGLGTWDYSVFDDRLELSPALAQAFGLPPDGSVGSFREMVRVVHHDDRDEVQRRFQAALSGGEPFVTGARVVLPGGDIRWFEATAIIVRDDSGQPVRVAGTALDVTERRTLEQQLQQAQKMEAMGRLAGGIAHDFNNLLTVIVCNAELLAARERGEEVAEILEAAGSAGELTQRLLAFTRQADLRQQVVDLNTVVAATVGMVERIIGEDVETMFTAASDLWPTRVDAAQIQQVLLNLATNARDAMPDGGRLTIHTENAASHLPRGAVSRGDYVCLSVSDTGAGMDDETRARAFDPFFTTKELGKGTGLGLAVVFGVAAQNRGHVELDSAPGEGTCVRLYLPRSRGTTVGVAEAKPDEAPTGRETVLVVEDAPAVCRLCRRTLESGGYTVLMAGDADEAMAQWHTHGDRIDLLLTDVVMPRTGGRELAARLVAARPSLKVLFMSGYAPKDDDVPVKRLASGFLAKPFTRSELLVKVRETLDAESVDPNSSSQVAARPA